MLFYHVLSNLCKSYGKNSSNRRFLTIVAPMYLSKWTRPYSAKSMACSAYSLFTFLTVTSTYSHFGLRPPVGISDLPTESGVVLSNSTLCFCRFIKILDSLDFGLDNGSYVGFLMLSVFFNPCGSYGTSQARWCLATGALSGNLWPKTG